MDIFRLDVFFLVLSSHKRLKRVMDALRYISYICTLDKRVETFTFSPFLPPSVSIKIFFLYLLNICAVWYLPTSHRGVLYRPPMSSKRSLTKGTSPLFN